MKNTLLIFVFALLSNVIYAQQMDAEDTFYVNVFINHDKEVRIESNLVQPSAIGAEVKQLIYNHPFKVDETLTYRIYADQSLDLGYIMDTEQKMLDAYSDNVKRERYLLETVNLNIDGPNWFKQIRELELKPIRG